MYKQWFNQIKQNFYNDFTTTALKTIIVLWAIGIILLVVFVVDNKWVLAGIAAYEMLP